MTRIAKGGVVAPKRRILIVDDNLTLARLLKMQLEEAGAFRAKVETRASQALAAMREFKPDLVILDVMMPEVDGGQIAAEMKADPALSTVPVIFLTGSVRKEEVAGREGIIGGMPFLAKPPRLEELLGWIERLAPARPVSILARKPAPAARRPVGGVSENVVSAKSPATPLPGTL